MVSSELTELQAAINELTREYNSQKNCYEPSFHSLPVVFCYQKISSIGCNIL